MHIGKMKITAANIRAARARVNENQEEFGRRFGVDQATISRWEAEGLPEKGPAHVAAEYILAEIASVRAAE